MENQEEEMLKYWESRCIEAEETLKACMHALALVPVTALQKGTTWIPSEIAIYQLESAKLAVDRFARRNWA